jgi:hypothetical protein
MHPLKTQLRINNLIIIMQSCIGFLFLVGSHLLKSLFLQYTTLIVIVLHFQLQQPAAQNASPAAIAAMWSDIPVSKTPEP